MQSFACAQLMCGMSSASYCTVTGADKPGMVSRVSSIGPDEIDTLAVKPPAGAISVSCAEPVGGLNVVCIPAISESVPPPVIDHVIAASLFDSVAVKSVGDDTV